MKWLAIYKSGCNDRICPAKGPKAIAPYCQKTKCFYSANLTAS